MTALLQVEGLARSFGAIKAVDGVSFEVGAGEVVGLIGPNGSGKSTLFNCILGQIGPSAGQVTFEGQQITRRSPLALNRLGIGRTFQMLQVFPRLSVRDNLIVAGQEHEGRLFGRLLAPPDAGLGAAADEMLEQFRLSHVAHQAAGDCSFGQQKLLDIAMAFMTGPRLVLLDEPAGGVNPNMLGDLHALLRRLNADRRTTFVVIEHNMEFVMRLCDRVLVLAQGRILAEGTPEQVRANPAVIEAYLGD
ncbi:MAG: ABC transporter ATP-binding protein [Alphaproteobacteria bacterium]|nr:ABC transporter ATP-binding protein [Alphaproteobacteria bacterium]